MDKRVVRSFDELPLVLSVLDVAAIMGISKNTAYELVHSQEFPKMLIGKQYRVPRERFLVWLDNCGMVA